MRWSLCLVLVALGCAGKSTTSTPPPDPAGAPGSTTSNPRSDPDPAAAPDAPVREPWKAKIECGRPEMFGPSMVDPQVYEQRHGAGATRFSEVVTTQEYPLEACGLETSLTELARLTCDDGRNPFGGDTRAAHASRAGNVGGGGRCEQIIDLYRVPCPEQEYKVFIDMYFCPSGEPQPPPPLAMHI